MSFLIQEFSWVDRDMFMHFRGGGISHKILRNIEHQLAENNEWEDIEDEPDVVMQDITEVAGPVEGDDANINDSKDIMVCKGNIDQNENKHEEEEEGDGDEGDGDGNSDDNNDSDNNGSSDGDDVDLGAEDGEIPDYIGKEADYDNL